MSRTIKIPDGFTFVTDEDYIIRDGDKYNLGEWLDKDNQHLPSLIGKSGYFVAIGKTLKWAQENCSFYGGIYLFSKNNNESNNKSQIPAGFTLVTDDNHIILAEDRYNLGIWGNGAFASQMDISWRGLTFADINKQYSKYGGFKLITKGESKPRFVCEKPFPHGY